jgi:DNA-binding CsgD family transcriptional regulator
VADVIDLQPRDQDIEDILSFIGGLTPAQRRIVAHLLKGDSVTEAAQQLGLSVNTVKSHLSQVFRRTGVSRVADLILLYVMPFVMLPEP